MLSDIEIQRKTKVLQIEDVIKNLNLPKGSYSYYGDYISKIDPNKIIDNKNGKIILVSAINPTSAGEGKTTLSIGLNDALNIVLKKENKTSILALREPSLGPVFGIKGGATGGGFAQVFPMENINLHFTGDFHAITSANNLLCSLIDNHIFQGNELNINPDKIIFNRCLDLNDRALRDITIHNIIKNTNDTRKEKFNITAASEVMAILSLSENIDELKYKLGNIMIGYKYNNEPVYAKDLKANEAMTILLKDAIKPNLVQTLENNPCLIHCGPFANIAHGCNSIIATKTASKIADYVVTEAGFGADLGAEKFLDIKCRQMKIKPSAVVLVATVKALKLHGEASMDEIKNNTASLQSLEKGLENLKKHIENIKNVYKLNCCVSINKFTSDTEEEIALIKNYVSSLNIKAIVCDVWAQGGKGALELATSVIELTKEENQFCFAYDINDPIKEKIEKIATKIYGARGVIYSEKSSLSLEKIEKLGYNDLPICIAKTQYSLSDDPNLLYIDKPFDITIKDLELRSGAGLIVAIAGSMLLMPGLGKEPQANKMTINNNIINNLF